MLKNSVVLECKNKKMKIFLGKNRLMNLGIGMGVNEMVKNS
jgi:hypothetical protein